MKVGIYTLGCKVNTYESEYVIGLLKEHGYTIGDFMDVCDVYIINTCTVTNMSDVKSRKMIRQAIKRNPKACVVAMGCFIEANKEYQELGLDIVIGNKDKGKIVELLEKYFKKQEEIRALYPVIDDQFEDMFITTFEGRTRAFVKIQDGCENFCSYCIIPYVRGKCRSKDPEVVIKEIETLMNHGYQEIVLTGIHTGNYGHDLNTSFKDLLKRIVTLPGLKRLRISSIEITELNDEVLELMRDHEVIVDHLHIPLQSGSNTILKWMNRKYDLNYFFHKIEQIRKIRPEISITTDVIVGFPHETEELFQETIETIQRIRFSKLHVFPYSVRSGTAASKMKEQVDQETKKERVKVLLQLSKKLEQEYFEQFINREVEVLVETNKEGYSYGHTGNYLPIKIKGEYPIHQMTSVWIEKVEYPYCLGSIKESIFN